MPPALDLPSITDQHAFNMARWQELVVDPEIAALNCNIETDRYGHVLMMSVPGFGHAAYQIEIGLELHRLLPGGKVLGECRISTSEGIKGADAAWISQARRRRAVKNDLLVIAPEICVEVLSAANTRAEMDEKKALYFESGADEVWLCDRKGRMFFFLKNTPNEPAEASLLCPAFPKKLSAA
jgi:Uma2 family endonuclease